MLIVRSPRIRIALIVACALLCLMAIPFQAATAKLTILHTNDIHGHLLPFDYDDLGRQLAGVGGAARRASLIRQIKSQSPDPVLVMDAGDVFVRGPLDSLNGEPDFEVMNAVPYDVMTIGNNELKGGPGPAGLSILKERIAQAKFPIVSANVYELSTGQRLVAPYKIFTLGGVRVAVMGLLTTADSKLPQFAPLRVEDPVACARLLVPELRKQADYVVALTHLGVTDDVALASSVPGIDVIIGGHSHTWLFAPLVIGESGTIICQDGEWGRTVGRLDLTLQQSADHGYRTSACSEKLVEVDSSIAPAADITAIVEKSAAAYAKPICRLASGIPFSQEADWVAARMREAAASDVAVEPADEIQQGLASGAVTTLDVRAMVAFVNQVDKMTVTGKQLRAFLLESPDCGLSGASLAEGLLTIGSERSSDTRSYSIAIEDYYARHSAALAGSRPTAIGASTTDLITRYLQQHCPRN